MTKMPDKIFAGFAGGGRFWGEVTPQTHPDNTVYIRSDLIPQPVTDEARAKALNLVERCRTTDVTALTWAEDRLDGAATMFFRENIKIWNTIKSALSQPPRIVRAASDMSDEDLAALEASKMPDDLAHLDREIEQPEAIQKAVEALESVLCDPHTGACVMQGSAGDKQVVEYALTLLRTHQSELEAMKVKYTELKKCLKSTQTSLMRVSRYRDELKAENADLRRAVVDFDNASNGDVSGGQILVRYSKALRENAATIDKAKAVKS